MTTPVRTQGHPKRWLTLIVLCLCTFVLVLDNTVLTVAIPTLSKDIGADSQDIQWIVDAYILVFAGLLLTAGGMSDRYGRRKVLLIGLVIFGLSSLLAAFAGNPEQLIAGRVLMGIGGSLIMPGTLSILITVFTEEERRKATSIWSTVLMLGMIGGPPLGGVIIQHFWWGAVFLVNVPVALVCAIAAVALMPESHGPRRKADPIGVIFSVVGVTALVWVIIEVPRLGIGDKSIITTAAIAVVALIVFVIRELSAKHPMVPLSLFRDRNFSGGTLTLVLVQLGAAGITLIMPQYFQFALNYSPARAGLAIIPMAISTIVGNTVGGSIGMKVSNRAMAGGGVILVIAGFVVLAMLAPADSYLMVAAALVLIGLGSGTFFPAATTSLMGAIPAEHAGVGAGLNDTIQQTGAAFGVAVLGSILANAYHAAMPVDAPDAARRSISEALIENDPSVIATARNAFTDAVGTTFTVAVGCSIVAFIVATTMLHNRKPTQAQQTEDATV